MRVKFKYPHTPTDPVVKPNFKKPGKEYVECMASTVKGGDDFCYSVRNSQTEAAKSWAKWKRVMKQARKNKGKSQSSNAKQVPATKSRTKDYG